MPSDPPSEVQITVTAIRSDRARRVGSRLRRRHAAAALALAAGVSAAVAIITLAGTRSPRAVTPATEATAAATAFGYPYRVRCVRITTSGSLMRVRVSPAPGRHWLLSGPDQPPPPPAYEQCLGVSAGAQPAVPGQSIGRNVGQVSFAGP